MSNTNRLYTAMRDFTNTRRENREIYLQKKQSLERFRGSAGYQKDLDAAMKIRKDADEVARVACQKIVDETLADMVKKNNSRILTPPSDETIRILTVAQMIKKPTKPTLDAIARSVGGNPLALAALTDIAREAWKDDPNVLNHMEFTRNYNAMATVELGASVAHDAIRSLGKSCSEIMRSSAERAAELAASIHSKHFGGTYDPDDLPQEAPFTSEQDFFERTLSVDFALFSKAVN